ncbi:uncharacterized protein [Zea mays]|uniref:uncharacterized protein n=1 Tax=Zea mays TaxID=4577 RepID=UPI0016522133|nr:uncharacterized protein LOC103646364 [Zea mays]
MARPEGSIAEAYVVDECLIACSRYFDDLDTRHNREGRNRERVDMSKGDLSVFQHGVDLLRAHTVTYQENIYDKMVWLYRKELENEGNQDIEKTIEKQFAIWFKNHIATLRMYCWWCTLPHYTTHPSSTATTNQESTQNITSATQFTSSAAAEQNYTQGMTAAAQANSPIQADISDHIADEELVPRQRSMGKQLESLSRGLGTKIPIQIYDGKRRPEPPIQAAKFASEGGIILRQHIPIFPHWKEYKKQENEGKITDYIGKLAGQFTMDVDSKAVKDACVDMIKGGQRQMRYRLKRKYFTGVPANQVRTTSPVPCMTDDQWKDLVQMWSTPNHKNNCVKNKLNREKVQFPQCIGSQSYIAKSYVVRQEKYKDMEPSAIDLFKEMHCSKKKGFSEAVQKAIGDMEAMVATPVEDGQHVLSSTEVVSNVLPGSSKFLHNAGLLPASKRSNTRTISTRMQELQTQLDTERQEKNGFREEMETLKAQSQASEATIANQSTEIADLKKSLSENNSLLRQILSINRGQMTPP